MRPPVSDAIGKVAIVGGGLAGLVAARRLHRAGIPFELIEARDRLGGRILSANASGAPSSDGFDLGPSWFWPQMQPGLAALVDELGLAVFRQHEDGDIVLQYRQGVASERYSAVGFQQSASARLARGMGALVSALTADLPVAGIRTGAAARAVTQTEDGIEVTYASAYGETVTLAASWTLLALPPRLLGRIERCFNRLKHFRRFATRYGRRTIHFRGFAPLAAAMIWMK